MDSSQTYINMCEQAKEIQDYKFPKGYSTDFTMTHPQAFLLSSCVCSIIPSDPHDLFWLRTGEQRGPYYAFQLIWLPRQDQLQAIGGVETVSDYSRWAYRLLDPFDWLFRYEIDWSMEQLWLAFVMEKLHSKHWNGEDWMK